MQRRNVTTRTGLLLTLMVLTVPIVRADEKLADIACRSVHLAWQPSQGRMFYNEIKVVKSAPGTYFMVCGWDKGYFGIQELANGKKVILFSVWDSGQNDPSAVEEEKRTRIVHQDKAVRIGRFGGEGTGGQSFFDYDWKVDETYRFLVTAKPDGARTEYAGYFFAPEEKSWKHLITFSTLSKSPNLRGYYSFVEDFRRNRVSATQARQAEFGNTWILNDDDKWQFADSARFTADSNPAKNIHAGAADSRFFLATGGMTPEGADKLNQRVDLNRDRNPEPKAPDDLPVK